MVIWFTGSSRTGTQMAIKASETPGPKGPPPSPTRGTQTVVLIARPPSPSTPAAGGCVVFFPRAAAEQTEETARRRRTRRRPLSKRGIGHDPYEAGLDFVRGCCALRGGDDGVQLERRATGRDQRRGAERWRPERRGARGWAPRRRQRPGRDRRAGAAPGARGRQGLRIPRHPLREATGRPAALERAAASGVVERRPRRHRVRQPVRAERESDALYDRERGRGLPLPQRVDARPV